MFAYPIISDLAFPLGVSTLINANSRAIHDLPVKTATSNTSTSFLN